ncbi:DUF5671 domain-containing protein [Salinibacterium sp. M195]|uniref:DUF5671 domain-containing protein n=1 Tax=Salinibacterium sp. M195 TaxID=2583374 RepID=UPI001C62865E|nr:DUF5671 domain-containing protein [Salinibacterium sp. M195]QYH35682.1 hypothetical protein FFT87_06775 [Salinibacterium sp. M195]
MTSISSTPTPPPSVIPAVGGVQTVRRVITYLLLATTVIIAASGVSGLLDRLFSANRLEVSFDNYGLATSLASALIAGPLAAVLWWLTWRDATMTRDRASVIWPVYLTIMSTVALLTSTIALFTWAAEAIVNGWQPYGLAVGIVWALVWAWHYWMWRHPSKAPTRLPGAAPAIASLIGLTYAAGGVVWALGQLIDSAVDAALGSVVISDPVWQLMLQGLVWAAGGALLWWWHWFRVGVREQSHGFSNVLLVFIAGIASVAVFAAGIMVALTAILELITASSQPLAVTLEPLGIAIANAVVGALVLVYHARVVTGRSVGVRSATRLASAGVSLAYAASGVGVMVNALLATSSNSLIEGDIRSLLLGGLSALLVGGALWWMLWKPLQASIPERVATPGRRVYLVIIFGVSALVALITLLVIGFQLFSFLLDGGSGESFVERSRQALGLLTATLLVAAYHFAIWRNDRHSDVPDEHVQRIGRVTLVASGDSAELVEAVRAATGARVSVLERADEVQQVPDAAAIVAALDGVEAAHVLVVAGVKGKVAVIRLKG